MKSNILTIFSSLSDPSKKIINDGTSYFNEEETTLEDFLSTTTSDSFIGGILKFVIYLKDVETNEEKCIP